MSSIPTKEIDERPAGYQGPNLSPARLQLVPRQLAPGVYALVANIPPKDNNGLIIGEKAALVVDAGITADVAHQIQRICRELTDKPLRYLANTTYHGDHTFGNVAFPAEVVITSSRVNKENMNDLEAEKKHRSGNMYGDNALDTVTEWRLPDVVFDYFAEIDLGEVVVRLYRFGPGNGPGDTIVYAPDARVAWTGNFLSHAGIAPMLLQGGPQPYIESLRHMRDELPDLETIVPGHGPIGNGPEAIEWLIGYLENLQDNIRKLRTASHSMEQILEEASSPFSDGLNKRLIESISNYDIPHERAEEQLVELMRHLHRLNVLVTYRALEDNEN